MEPFGRDVEEFKFIFNVHYPVARSYVTIEYWEGIVRWWRANSRFATMISETVPCTPSAVPCHGDPHHALDENSVWHSY